MSEYVQTWFNTPCFFQETRTAETNIEMISGRSVGYQDISGYRNSVVPRGLITIILKTERFSAEGICNDILTWNKGKLLRKV
jgi:hypothetical protein